MKKMRRGIVLLCTRFLSGILILSLLLANSKLDRVFAFYPLDSLSDIISSNTPLQTGVVHTISFNLPANAPQVDATDYILISLPNYTSISTPYEVEGGFGAPIFSVSDKTVRISNLVINPGSKVKINGVTARNPAEGADDYVSIMIATDTQMTNIKCMGVFHPDTSGSYIYVSAAILSQMSSTYVSGYTSSQSFVTITENGIAIGTTTSDDNGYFVFPIGGLPPGSHIFSIVGTDHYGLSTSQTNIEVFLLPNTSTSVTGIMLSPTVSLDKDNIAQGDVLTIIGSARPLSTVNIFTESPLRSYVAETDEYGFYEYELDGVETLTYAPGDYRTFTNVQDGVGNQSNVSLTANFTVNQSEDPDNQPPECDISQGDLNCDGQVNLTDFSILLYHWGTNHKKGDINSDGIVNLIDFSVMMYYFRR